MNNLEDRLKKKKPSRDMIRKITSEMRLKPVIKDTSNRNPILNYQKAYI